jgi:sugar phosphate isomerase/epimerase
MKLGTVSNLISVPDGEDPYLFRIDRAAELGLQVLGISFRDIAPDPAYLDAIAARARDKGIELRMGGVGVDFHLDGPEAEADRAQAAERIKTICHHTGVSFVSIVSGPIQESHRFKPGKPMAERIETVSRNMGAFADLVADADIMLGMENHCDYRGHEVATIVTRANRPNLRVQIDTGNAFSVFEEPVDCAEALAPLVVSAHLKDIHVTPLAPRPCQGTRGVSVPLGEGHVDNVTICQILQDKSPDPDSLALMVEPFYLPDDADPDEFLATSIAWSREHLASFLNEATTVSS